MAYSCSFQHLCLLPFLGFWSTIVNSPGKAASSLTLCQCGLGLPVSCEPGERERCWEKACVRARWFCLHRSWNVCHVESQHRATLQSQNDDKTLTFGGWSDLSGGGEGTLSHCRCEGASWHHLAAVVAATTQLRPPWNLPEGHLSRRFHVSYLTEAGLEKRNKPWPWKHITKTQKDTSYSRISRPGTFHRRWPSRQWPTLFEDLGTIKNEPGLRSWWSVQSEVQERNIYLMMPNWQLKANLESQQWVVSSHSWLPLCLASRGSLAPLCLAATVQGERKRWLHSLSLPEEERNAPLQYMQ